MLVEMILKSFNRVDLINRLKDLYSVHAFLNVIITVDSWLAYLFKTWNSWIPFSHYVSTIRIEITCCRRQEAKTNANMQGQNIPKINKPVMTCYFLEASSYDFFSRCDSQHFPPCYLRTEVALRELVLGLGLRRAWLDELQGLHARRGNRSRSVLLDK